MRLQHVVSGVRSIPSAIIYHAYIDGRTGLRCNVYTPSRNARGGYVSRLPLCPCSQLRFSHTDCCTYRHVTAPPDRPRAPNSGDGRFQAMSNTRQSVLCYRYVLTQCGSEERYESRARVRSELAYTP